MKNLFILLLTFTLFLSTNVYGGTIPKNLSELKSGLNKIQKINKQKLTYSIVSFSPKEFASQREYPLEGLSVDEGHYMHFVHLHDLNPTRSYQFKNKRKITGRNSYMTISEISSEQLIENTKSDTPTLNIISLTSKHFLPGEEVDFLIQSDDGKESANFTLIPNPAVAKSKVDNAKIEAKIRSIKPTMYTLFLEGFKKNEKVIFTTISKDEVIKSEMELDTNIAITFMPEVMCETEGVSIIHIERAGNETLTLHLPWGYELLHHVQGLRLPMN